MKSLNNDNKVTESDGKVKKVDRRTLRTKRAILKALFGLMEEKDVGKITITELAEKADIDRKTFYLHYDSIQSVISEVEDNLVSTVMKFAGSAERNGDSDAFFAGINRTIRENFEFIRYFVTSGAYTFFMSKVSEAFRTYVFESIIKDDSFASGHDRQVVSLAMVNLASGITAMYLKWFQSENSVSLEELGTIARKMSTAVIESIKDNLDGDLNGLENFFGC